MSDEQQADLQTAVHHLELVHQIAAEILRRGQTPHEQVALAQLTRALCEARADLEGESGARLTELLADAEACAAAWQLRAEHLRSKRNQLLAGEA
jgi:hypothetical protein